MNILDASITRIKELKGIPQEYPLFSIVSDFNDFNFFTDKYTFESNDPEIRQIKEKVDIYLSSMGAGEINNEKPIISHSRVLRDHIVARIKDRKIYKEWKFKKVKFDFDNGKPYKLLENNREGIRIRSFNNSEPFRVNKDNLKKLSQRV